MEESVSPFTLLVQAREAQQLSQKQLAQRLKMSERHIIALEEGRLDDLPFAGIYRRKLIDQYLAFLRIHNTTIKDALLSKETPPFEDTTSPSSSAGRCPFYLNLPIVARFAMAIFFIGSVAAYLGIQIYSIVTPPELIIFSPSEVLTTADRELTIQGKTDPEAQVFINGQPVRNDEQGFFEADMSLSEGVNTILTSAKKQHSQAQERLLQITYQPPDGSIEIRRVERD